MGWKVRSCVGTGVGLAAILLVGLLIGLEGGPARGSGSASAPRPIGLTDLVPSVGYLSVSISAAPPVVEPGTPVLVGAFVSGGTPPYSIGWSDSNARSATGAGWTTSTNTSGNLSIVCRVTDAQAGVAASTAVVPVLDPPELSFAGTTEVYDASQSLRGNLSVGGGAAPYELSYGLLGGGPSYSERLASSGSYPFVVPLPASGSIEVVATVVDALGGGANASAYEGPAGTPPALSASPPPPSVDAGSLVSLGAVVSGGTAPIRWSASASATVDAPQGSTGVLANAGLIHWVVAFPSPGNVTVLLQAEDADGRASLALVNLTVAEPLVALASGPSSPVRLGETVAALLTIAGGTPPYLVLWTASDGESGVANLTAGGTLVQTLRPASVGNLTMNGTVTDLGGGIVRYTVRSAIVSAPSGTDPPGLGGAAETGLLGLAAGAGAIAGGFGVTLWRRRPAPAAPPGPSPDPSNDSRVEQIVSEAEALEPETALQMAEEQGIARTEAQSSLDRAARAGRIRTETGADGEPLLRWIGGPAPPPAEDPP